MYDGFITVDFGRWHFHLCIGEHTASGPELGRIRAAPAPSSTAASVPDGTPTTWDNLRAKYLNLESDPYDRTGKGFKHA